MLVPKIPISGNRLIQRNKRMEYPKSLTKKFVPTPKEINKLAILQKYFSRLKKKQKNTINAN